MSQHATYLQECFALSRAIDTARRLPAGGADIARLEAAVRHSSVIEHCLQTVGSADIGGRHWQDIVPVLKAQPACQLGTPYSCGVCKWRIFTSEEARHAHLLAMMMK